MILGLIVGVTIGLFIGLSLGIFICVGDIIVPLGPGGPWLDIQPPPPPPVPPAPKFRPC